MTNKPIQQLFRLPSGGLYFQADHYSTYLINDRINKGREFSIEEPLLTLEYVKEYQVLDGYIDGSGYIMSIEEYTTREQTLKSKANNLYDDECRLKFDDLDDEIAWLTLNRTYKPHYNIQIQTSPVEFEIIDLPPKSSKYPDRIHQSYRTSNVLNPMCSVNIRDYLVVLINNAKTKYSDSLDPTKETGLDIKHPNLEYWKINGNYIDAFKGIERNQIFRGTMEECEDRLERYEKQVDLVFERNLKKTRKFPSYHEVISDTEHVMGLVRNIEAKQKSTNLKYNTVMYLSGMLTKYQEALDNETL